MEKEKLEQRIDKLIAVLQLEKQADGYFHTSWGKKSYEGLVETIMEVLNGQ